MRNKLLSALLGCALAIGAAMPIASANHIDTYRNLLKNRTYTIKYENITPLPRNENKDSALVVAGEMMGDMVSNDYYLQNRQYRGVLVANGNDRFTEIIRDKNILILGIFGSGRRTDLREEGICKLTKGGETFFYSWITKDGKTDYKDFQQDEQSRKPDAPKTAMEAFAAKMEATDFGDAEMNLLLGAILPSSEKIAAMDMPEYGFVGSGWLDNGLSYEDYASEKDGTFSAIRYYFDGNSLVKIAAASYFRDANGVIQNYNKYIVRITEFSPTPDAKCLSLPEKFAGKVKKGTKGEDD